MSMTNTTGIDSGAVRELSEEVHKLNLIVMQVKTLMEQFGPMLAQQVTGLADTQNRVTRVEDKCAFIEGRMADNTANLLARIAQLEKKAEDDKKEALEREKATKDLQNKQIEANRYLISTVIAVIVLAIGVATFFIKNVQVKP